MSASLAITVLQGFQNNGNDLVNLDFSAVNWLAVGAAALAAFVIAAIWYTALFGKPWLAAHNYTEEQVAAMKAANNPAKFFGGMLVSYFALALVIGVIVARFELHTWQQGAKVGLALWIAVAAVSFTNFLPTNKRLPVYVIDVTCELVYLVAMGVIIGVWK